MHYWFAMFSAVWTCAASAAAFVVWRRTKNAVLLPGTILSITQQDQGEVMFSPVIQFQNREGQMVTFQSGAYATDETFWGRVGDIVTVALDPYPPHLPDLHTPVFNFVIGALLVSVGVGMTAFFAFGFATIP